MNTSHTQKTNARKKTRWASHALALVLSCALCLALVPAAALPALASELQALTSSEVDSGTLDSLTWTLYEDGELVISGDGAMLSYSSGTKYPWYSYRKSVTSLTVSEGVTSIGYEAFWASYTNLTTATLASTVTSIEERAFWFCDALASISFGSGLESIGAYAFYCCWDLQSIELPDSVTTIGIYAFENCDSMESLHIGAGLEELGYGALSGLIKLSTLTVSSDNTAYCTSDGVLYDAAMTELIKCPVSIELSSYTIPDSVTVIDEEAFCYCENLTYVDIGDGVEEIGDYAFYTCYLSEVRLGESLRVIGDSAFYLCSRLTSVEFPESLECIAQDAFMWCFSLTSVSEIGANVSDIGASPFNDCPLEEISVSSDNECYTSIDGVLYDADVTELVQYPRSKADESYTVPDTVRVIGEEAFAWADNVTEIVVGDSVTDIGELAFYACYALQSITFGDAVTRFGYDALNYCNALTSVYFKGNAPETMWGDALKLGRIMDSFHNDMSITLYYPAEDTTWSSEYRSTCDASMDDDVTLTWETWDTPTVTKVPMSECTITLSKSTYTYDGTEKVPSVTVKAGSSKLVQGVNYDVSYADNVNAGTATVTVTGYGLYTGSAEKSYTINKASQSITAGLSSTTIEVGGTSTLTASGIGTLSYASASTSIATVSSTGIVTGVSTGSTTITVSAAGNDNYKAATKSLSLTVEGTSSDVDVSSLTYSFSNSSSSFGYSNSYYVPLEIFEMFYSTEKASTYWKKYGKWQGSCFGFSSTSGMFNVTGSTLETTDFNSSADAVSDLAVSDTDNDIDLSVQELLEAMQSSQYLSSIQSCYDNYENQYDTIVSLVDAVQDGGCPPVIAVWNASGGGHALVGYKVKKVSSTRTYLYVYDCNYPGEERYITLTTTASGTYTGFSYIDDSYTTYTSKIACVPYSVYQAAWSGRLTHTSSSVNTLITDSENFTVRDAQGSTVATMQDGTFTSVSDDVYLGKSLDASDDEPLSVHLPTGTYEIVNTDTTQDLEFTMVSEDQSAEVSTQAESVQVLLDDSQLADVVNIEATDGETYTVELASGLEGQPTDVESVVYSGTCVEDEPTVGFVGGEPVTEDYSQSYAEVGGTYAVVNSSSATSIGVATFKLDKTSMSCDDEVPNVTLTYDSRELVEGTDYELVYSAYDEQGTATVTAYGINAYRGSIAKTFTVSACEEHSYDDGIVTLEPTYTTEGVRTYTCQYCGETKTQSIEKVQSPDEDISSASVKLVTRSYTYSGSAKKPTVTSVTLEDGTKLDADDYTVTYANNVNAGTATVTVTAATDSGYTGSVSTTFTIEKQALRSAAVKLAWTSKAYAGKTLTPGLSVKNAAGKKLTRGSSADYTVSYSKSKRKAVGAYKMTIKGTGNYTGTVSKTYKIVPKKATVVSAKSKAKHKLTVNWKKLGTANATSYEIRYRVKGAKKWKSVIVKAGKTTCTLKKLKSGKNYQVKVRARKIVSGTAYYGAWSKTKTVRVK